MRALTLPLLALALGALPLAVEVRLSGDGGVPVAATDSPQAEAYRRMARGLVAQLA